MKLRSFLPPACLAVASLAFSLVAHAATTAPLSLFDGRTLAGWEGNRTLWHVEDGAITGEIAAGATLALSAATSVYGEIGTMRAASGNAQHSGGLNGTVGLRVRW